MIFGGQKFDDGYHRWFAWRPVILRGPDEWDRQRFDRCRQRVAWLRFIWRMRTEFGTYYAAP